MKAGVGAGQRRALVWVGTLWNAIPGWLRDFVASEESDQLQMDPNGQ